VVASASIGDRRRVREPIAERSDLAVGARLELDPRRRLNQGTTIGQFRADRGRPQTPPLLWRGLAVVGVMKSLASRRFVSICVAAAAVSALPGLTAFAAASAHAKPRPSRTLILHPKFQRVRGSSLLASDRYVFIRSSGSHADQGPVIDSRTMRRHTVSAPGCQPSALGGPWLAFTCGTVPNQTFQLYDIPTRRYQPFTGTVQFGFCTTNCLPIVAIGKYWVAFEAATLETHASPRFFFQNIVTGNPPGDANGSTNIDLDSPQLDQKICPPLSVPAVSTPDGSPAWGSLVFDNGFAIASGSGGTYLERCGSHQREFLTFTTANARCSALVCPPAHDSHAIVWQSAAGRLNGIFLPSKQKFTIPVPPTVDPNQPGFANGDRYQLALTPTRLYLITPQGGIWSFPAPASPKPSRRRHA
jgi:hypothetical protein